MRESEDTAIPAPEAQLRDCENGIENMVNAVQADILTSSAEENPFRSTEMQAAPGTRPGAAFLPG